MRPAPSTPGDGGSPPPADAAPSSAACKPAGGQGRATCCARRRTGRSQSGLSWLSWRAPGHEAAPWPVESGRRTRCSCRIMAASAVVIRISSPICSPVAQFHCARLSLIVTLIHSRGRAGGVPPPGSDGPGVCSPRRDGPGSRGGAAEAAAAAPDHVLSAGHPTDARDDPGASRVILRVPCRVAGLLVDIPFTSTKI